MNQPSRPLPRLAQAAGAGLIALSLIFVAGPAPGHAAEEGAPDIKGWRGVEWGMPVAQAMKLFKGAYKAQQTKFEIAGCYYQYAVPILLFGEDWDIWLCEDREKPVVVALNVERWYHSEHYEDILAELSDAYGPPQRYWNCVNPLGNGTEQYRWYFPSTTVTLLNRDKATGWVMFRYERRRERLEFGPGICAEPPVDLR